MTICSVASALMRRRASSYFACERLGPWRPGVARSLAQAPRPLFREMLLRQEMVSGATEEQRHRAARELQTMRAKTRAELKKLHRIQEG